MLKLRRRRGSGGEGESREVKLAPWLVDALMLLQYQFPLDARDPYEYVADMVGETEDKLLKALRRLAEAGVLRRIGFHYNVRAEGRTSVLAAFASKKPSETARWLVEHGYTVTHCYLREHPKYNLWVVYRASSLDEAVEAARRACEETSCDAYVVLPAVRVHRLSVKYDLYRGISRASMKAMLPVNPPSPEELGYKPALAKALSRLPLEPRPYKLIGEEFDMSEREVMEAAARMLEAGILWDPGATLAPEPLGFKVNVMYVLKPRAGVTAEYLARWLAEYLEEATHIVERRILPEGSDWEYPVYAMVHARSEELLEPVVAKLEGAPAASFAGLRSIRDLMPEAKPSRL